MVKEIKNKNINPLRHICKFVDGRKDSTFYKTRTAFKGYMKDGYYCGLTIIYYVNGGLCAVGNYSNNTEHGNLLGLGLLANRKIDLWKYYNQNGTINQEELHIH